MSEIHSARFGDGMSGKRILMSVILILTVQCSLFRRRQVSPQLRADMAMLQTSSKMDVYVYSIDEKRAAQGDDVCYELAPGVHTITIRFRINKTASGTPIPNSTEFDLAIDAKAGKSYQIEHVKNADYSKWSTCIIDATSRNRVSYIITNKD
jgi:plastocyanin